MSARSFDSRCSRESSVCTGNAIICGGGVSCALASITGFSESLQVVCSITVGNCDNCLLSKTGAGELLSSVPCGRKLHVIVPAVLKSKPGLAVNAQLVTDVSAN